MRQLLMLAVIAGLMVSACKKYPDGPGMSFRSKTERLANTWYIQQIFQNGVDKTTDVNTLWNGYSLSIGKSGTYTINYRILGLVPYSEAGNWAFNGDKSKVIFTRTTPTPSITSEWTILRLKEKELWGQYNDSTVVTKVLLAP